jgi:predicted small metal-binding protein
MQSSPPTGKAVNSASMGDRIREHERMTHNEKELREFKLRKAMLAADIMSLE